MGAHTHVILLTGFLGSGKTSLLNRLIAAVPDTLRLLVLVNEFGELGIDGSLVDRRERELDLIEISKGSIFCACIKEDFIKSLIRIADELRPNLLVMEATGVANPSDLRRDLRLPVFGGRFLLAEQICLIDAQNFLDTRNVFVSIDKQIASSTLFVLNKTDLATPEQIAAIRAVIAGHHPHAAIFETTHAAIPLDALLSPVAAEAGHDAPEEPVHGEAGGVMSGLLLDPFREMAPPEHLISLTVEHPGARPEDAAAFLRALPDGVVRGKGFFRDGGTIFLVERVIRKVTILPVSTPIPTGMEGRMALIFAPEDEERVSALYRQWRDAPEDGITHAHGMHAAH